MTNSLDPNQTPRSTTKIDLGRHCLLKPICLNTLLKYEMVSESFVFRIIMPSEIVEKTDKNTVDGMFETILHYIINAYYELNWKQMIGCYPFYRQLFC